MRDLLDAALEYAGLGWPIIPCHWIEDGRCSCGNRGCESPGKHPHFPGHSRKTCPDGCGLYHASTDLGTVYRWWTKECRCNIATRTGVVADVLDVDSQDGLDALDAAWGGSSTGLDDPDAFGPVAFSGSGFPHIYLRPSGHGNRTRFITGCDFRGQKGYALLPPSNHVEGSYVWADGHAPETPIPAAPTWLLGALAPADFASANSAPQANAQRVAHSSAYGQRALEAEVGRVVLAQNGQRNDTLNRSAFSLGQLVAGGVLDAQTVAAALYAAATKAGLGHAEVAGTVRSGLANGGQSPRGVPS